MIAIALACKPRLLIADEPTTGLDVTTQKAIVDLLVALAAERGMATVLITHDLALASERCSRLAVMQGGRVVEIAETVEILRQPREPYTRSLIAATPRADEDTTTRTGGAPAAVAPQPLLAVESLCRDYRLRAAGGMAARAWGQISRPGNVREIDILRAVDNVTFDLSPGESVGLVGESGSGKSTLAALIVRLIDPTAGRIRFRGEDMARFRHDTRPEQHFAEKSRWSSKTRPPVSTRGIPRSTRLPSQFADSVLLRALDRSREWCTSSPKWLDWPLPYSVACRTSFRAAKKPASELRAQLRYVLAFSFLTSRQRRWMSVCRRLFSTCSPNCAMNSQ